MYGFRNRSFHNYIRLLPPGTLGKLLLLPLRNGPGPLAGPPLQDGAGVKPGRGLGRSNVRRDQQGRVPGQQSHAPETEHSVPLETVKTHITR